MDEIPVDVREGPGTETLRAIQVLKNELLPGVVPVTLGTVSGDLVGHVAVEYLLVREALQYRDLYPRHLEAYSILSSLNTTGFVPSVQAAY